MNELLPIVDALPALKATLRTTTTVVLQAPPGAGKSTVLPLELLDERWLAGRRIVMLEPRRLAARSVAARMASTCGDALGRTVGYRVRFENKVSSQTRIEVVTEGILTRRLQGDPGLDGVGLVIFDEFHERSLHADLALALCREAQSALRDDLRILIMSATLDGDALSIALDHAPVITVTGRQYPVELIYALRDPEGPLPVAVADGVSRALAEHNGDVLAFLPGVSEIQRAQALLETRHPEITLRPLYGELSLDAQQTAILPDPQGRRKVVLATSIAETSLTIVGTSVVVDCGFARVPRFDAGSGMTRLETARITLDSADQRAGRAGRLGPGVCYRLWSSVTHSRLNAVRKPEIVEADLAPLRLELAQWGVRGVADLKWVTTPPVGAVRQAEHLLETLGAMRGAALTPRGRDMADWPTHPRLAHLLVEARDHSAASACLAADVAALLDERDPLPRSAGADLSLRVEALRHWRQTGRTLHDADTRALARIERIAAQWRQQLNLRLDNAHPDAHQIGWLLSLAYPDRIAQARSAKSDGRYKLSGGRGVRLSETDPLLQTPLLAVAHLDAGGDEGRVHLAAPLHEDVLEPLTADCDVVGWDARQGVLVARRERRVGELVLSSKPLGALPAAEKAATLCQVARSEGLALLGWNEGVVQWRARAQCLHIWRGEEWPDLSDDALLATLEAWLAPWLEKVNRRDDFARVPLLDALRSRLTHRQLTQLDALAPAHIEVPSGSQIQLVYSPDGTPPVLAVKLQEMFGRADTPLVNDGRTKVMLHLLSPARRPIQVTQDLRSFWTNTYPIVRKELRGRYNKHPWPEDPWNAPPTRKTVRASKA